MKIYELVVESMTRKEQEQPKTTGSRIPTFKAIEEEEVAFCDAHSSEDFADELPPAVKDGQ